MSREEYGTSQTNELLSRMPADSQRPSWLNYKPQQKESLGVKFFFEHMKDRFKLKLLAGEGGFDKQITDKNLHRPGLALAGYVGLFTFHRIQIFGNTELYYLSSLGKEDRIKAFSTLASFNIPCIIITNANEFDPELIALCNEHNIPTFLTPIETTKAIYFISDFLDDQFNLHTSIHGSFIDVYGVGILFVGKSSIGKSEVALDLIERGHRLVADDVVVVTQKGEGILMGSGTELGGHFMEIRGLGIINVREMFGIRAIRFQKRVEVIVELEVWDEKAAYTRTGLDESLTQILGVELQHVKLPILPGKNITVISEVIALNYLLKHYGYDASSEFAKNLEQKIANRTNASATPERVIPYFEHDFE
ncbi:MAG: HPr(Ser) kinase/phosphatase [bacterium]